MPRQKKIEYVPVMIPFKFVQRLHWDKLKGAGVKAGREKAKQREAEQRKKQQKLQQELEEIEEAINYSRQGFSDVINCSPQFLQNIEDGTIDSVDAGLLADICSRLKIRLIQDVLEFNRPEEDTQGEREENDFRDDGDGLRAFELAKSLNPETGNSDEDDLDSIPM